MTINHQIIWNEAKDYIFITLGLCLYAFAWTIFLLPYEIVTGGITGLSAIIFYAVNVPIENSNFIINVLLLIPALKILGFKFLIKTIYAILVLSFLLWLTQELMPVDAERHYVKILGEGQDFMSLLIGCMMTGTSLAIVFMNNGSTGGTDIIAASVNKFFNFSLGQVLIGVDLCIIGSCLFIPEFGDSLSRIHKVVFGLCTMVVENFMLDYVMNARRESVQFMIFSKKYMEIANAIGTEMDHGVTILDGHGWYTGQEARNTVVALVAGGVVSLPELVRTAHVDCQRLPVRKNLSVHIAVKRQPCVEAGLAESHELDYITVGLSGRLQPVGLGEIACVQSRKLAVLCIEVGHRIPCRRQPFPTADGRSAAIEGDAVGYAHVDRVLIVGDDAENCFAVTLFFGRAHEVTHLHDVLAGHAVKTWIGGQVEAVVLAQSLGGGNVKQFSLSLTFSKVYGFSAGVEGSLPFCSIICVADELLVPPWDGEFIVFPFGIRERTVPQGRCRV